MPLMKSKVNNMERTYLIVYDDDTEGPLALSPSLVRRGRYCARKYNLDIPESPTYQRQQQQLIAALDTIQQKDAQIEEISLSLQSENKRYWERDKVFLAQLYEVQVQLTEMTRQRDWFASALKRTTNHLVNLKTYLNHLSLPQRLLLAVTGFREVFLRFEMKQAQEADND